MKILLTILFPFLLFGNVFTDRLINAKSGDFVVYENNKNASLFVFTKIDQDKITLEEISFPSYLNLGIKDIKHWVEKKAPGHTSWRIYELDKNTFDLIEAYSFKDQSHIAFPQDHFFLSTLLNLELKPLSDSSRRKVGSSPPRGKKDERKNWNPPIIIDGKKQKKDCVVFFAKWPKDHSDLSEKMMEIYFGKNHSFFPYWIEIHAAKTSFTTRVIDSGNQPFPIRNIPKRRPFFVKRPDIEDNQIKIHLNIPKYFQSIDIVATDLLESHQKLIPLTFKIEIDQENVLIKIEAKNLEKERPYRITIIPKEFTNYSCETTLVY